MLCVFSALFTASAGSRSATGLAGAAGQHHHPVSFLSVAGRMVCMCVCGRVCVRACVVWVCKREKERDIMCACDVIVVF